MRTPCDYCPAESKRQCYKATRNKDGDKTPFKLCTEWQGWFERQWERIIRQYEQISQHENHS